MKQTAQGTVIKIFLVKQKQTQRQSRLADISGCVSKLKIPIITACIYFSMRTMCPVLMRFVLILVMTFYQMVSNITTRNKDIKMDGLANTQAFLL